VTELDNVGCKQVGRMERDRLGRRRHPEQERGLRPLHPLLPEEWVSKALRVAMSETDWAEFEALVARFAAQAPTQARAIGMVLSGLLHGAESPEPEPGPSDWMDWERRKALRLLLSKAKTGPLDWMDWERRKTLRLLIPVRS
jgi:hypothetical protein